MNLLLFRLALLGFFFGLILSACGRSDPGVTKLRHAGYTDIKVLPVEPKECPAGSLAATRFKATSPTGREVSGLSCNVPGLGTTIQLD